MKKFGFLIALVFAQSVLAQNTNPLLEGQNHVQCMRQHLVTGKETVTDYPAMVVHKSGQGVVRFTDSAEHEIELYVEKHKIRSLTITDLVSKNMGTFGNYEEGSIKVGGLIRSEKDQKKITSVYVNCTYVRAK